MDYWTWGKEYLDQADRLGKRIESLRKQQKSLSGRTAAKCAVQKLVKNAVF